MKESFKQTLYYILLTFFIIVIFLTILSFQYSGDNSIMNFFLKNHIFFMFFIAIFGVIFGSFTQIMTSKKIENSNNSLILLKKHFKKSISKDELKILNYLIRNKGISTQYELTKLDNLNKLKVSRLLIEMENKDLLSKEKIGKINKVFLNSELLEIFKN